MYEINEQAGETERIDDGTATDESEIRNHIENFEGGQFNLNPWEQT